MYQENATLQSMEKYFLFWILAAGDLLHQPCHCELQLVLQFVDVGVLLEGVQEVAHQDGL